MLSGLAPRPSCGYVSDSQVPSRYTLRWKFNAVLFESVPDCPSISLQDVFWRKPCPKVDAYIAALTHVHYTLPASKPASKLNECYRHFEIVPLRSSARICSYRLDSLANHTVFEGATQ